MNTAAASFFSRDVFLRRQARISRKRTTPTNLCPSTSTTQEPLPMIDEEDENRASTSRSSSPNQYSPTTRGILLRSKRQYANLNPSDIRLAKIAHEDMHFAQHDINLLFSPRSTPPAVPSPESSPDTFSLRFPEGELKFPHPAIPIPSSFDGYRTGSESPTPSMSSSYSTSSETRSSGLPMTPSSSDDECPSYYYSPTPAVKPRRVTIKPLVINKHNPPVALPESIPPIHSTLPSTFVDDSQYESDSEWYSREFSQILTLDSPFPLNPSSKVRPDSIYIADNVASRSLVPALSSPRQGFPSSQLDPSFPPQRRSRINIPSYPPPPVPTSPSPKCVPTSSSPTKVSRPRSDFLPIMPPPRRPPPRSSIPADCVLIDDTFTFSDDAASAFSLSLYDDSPSTGRRTDNPKSGYFQQSIHSPHRFPFPATPLSAFPTSVEDEFDFEDIQFDLELERLMMLPLDLPNSPLDLEADLTSRFERLRNEPYPQAFRAGDAPASEASPALRCPSVEDDSRELRSRWSSSTLASVREEHAKRSGLGVALRSYFGSSTTKLKSRSSSTRRSRSEIPKNPLPPTSPARLSRHARRESDIMVIGYGYPTSGEGLRRRGSLSSTVSDASSDESSSSTSSSGLRRNSIRVEMFLRA